MGIPVGHLIFCIAVLLGSGVGVRAYAAGFGVPLSGFILDARSQSIRPIQGLPGASLVGNALDLPFNFKKAAFAFQNDFALAINANGSGQVVLVRGLRGGIPTAAPLDGAMAGVDLIALSGSESVAALYSKATAQVQFVTALPAQPIVSSAVSLAGLPGDVLAIAAGASGSALACLSDGMNGAVYAVWSRDGGSVERLALAQKPAAVVYVNGENDAVFADGLSDELILIRDLRGLKTASTLASSDHGYHTPVAVQVWKGTHLLMASTGSQNVVDFDLQQGIMAGSTDLPVSPTRLDSLIDPGLFIVNEIGAGPLYLMDPAAAVISFVPAN